MWLILFHSDYPFPMRKSTSVDFLLYTIGFIVPTFLFGKYLYGKTINEYLTFMVVVCPLSFWIIGKVKGVK